MQKIEHLNVFFGYLTINEIVEALSKVIGDAACVINVGGGSVALLQLFKLLK